MKKTPPTLTLSKALQDLEWFLDEDNLEKGTNHKYIRRIPTGKVKPKYYYVYSTNSKHHGKAPKEGDAFRISSDGEEGHYHVTKVDADGRVHAKHDESGDSRVFAAGALEQLWQQEHEAAIIDKHEKLKDTHRQAQKTGTSKQKKIAKLSLDQFVDTHKITEKKTEVPTTHGKLWEIYQGLLGNAGITDHDSSAADQKHNDAKNSGTVRSLGEMQGGALDAFNEALGRKKRLNSAFHGFEAAVKQMKPKTLADLQPIVAMLRTVPGLERVQVPGSTSDAPAEKPIQPKDVGTATDGSDDEADDDNTGERDLSGTVMDDPFDYGDDDLPPFEVDAADQPSAAPPTEGGDSSYGDDDEEGLDDDFNFGANDDEGDDDFDFGANAEDEDNFDTMPEYEPVADYGKMTEEELNEAAKRLNDSLDTMTGDQLLEAAAKIRARREELAAAAKKHTWEDLEAMSLAELQAEKAKINARRETMRTEHKAEIMAETADATRAEAAEADKDTAAPKTAIADEAEPAAEGGGDSEPEPAKHRGRGDYASRQSNRIDRLESAADRAAANSNAARSSAVALAGTIPLGQPILVGHHSEKRARRDLERIQAGHRKAAEEADKAKRLARRAASVGGAGISQDDPEAVTKIKDKIAKLERWNETAKQVNKDLRAGRKLAGGKGNNDDRGAELIQAGIDHALKNVPEEHAAQARSLLDRMAFAYPWPPKLGTKTPEIRRLKDRIQGLENLNAETKETDLGHGVTMIDNVEDNRLQLDFPGKPSAEVRQALKRNGFKWSRAAGVWQRFRSNGAEYGAQRVAAAVAEAKA